MLSASHRRETNAKLELSDLPDHLHHAKARVAPTRALAPVIKTAKTVKRKVITNDDRLAQKVQRVLKQADHMGTHSARMAFAARALFGKKKKELSVLQCALANAMGHLGDADISLFELMIKALGSYTNKDGTSPNVGDADTLLDAATERIYSPGPPVVYGEFQQQPYHKPRGWVRWNVAGCEANDPCFGWSVAYHGTSPEALLAIADQGLISPADRNTVALHGQAGASLGALNKTLYTSQCSGYSAHPVYTPLIKVSAAKAAQIMLQVRVNQSAICNRLKTTLGKLHWKEGVPFEGGFTADDDMEWLLTDRDAVKITGVMFREIGCKTELDRERYGATACAFSPRGDAPQFKWTDHLANAVSAGIAGA